MLESLAVTRRIPQTLATMSDLDFPWYSEATWALAFFLFFVTGFHVLLVWLFPLGKRGWKKVDYWVSAFALLGLVGSLGSVRQLIAQNMSTLAQSRLEAENRFLISQLDFGSSPAICRKFERTQFSPPPDVFDQRQQEFDLLCHWFESARAKLSREPLAEGSSLTIEYFGTPLPKDADGSTLRDFQASIVRYNDALSLNRNLSAASQRTELEQLLFAFGPLLGAVALALRITKVSGELNLDPR